MGALAAAQGPQPFSALNTHESKGASAETVCPAPVPTQHVFALPQGSKRTKTNQIKSSQSRPEFPAAQTKGRGCQTGQGPELTGCNRDIVPQAVTGLTRGQFKAHSSKQACRDQAIPPQHKGTRLLATGVLPRYLSQALLQNLHVDSEELSCEVIYLDGAREKDRPDQFPLCCHRGTRKLIPLQTKTLWGTF